MASLLVELLVEELPPKALRKLGDAFAALLAEGLAARGLASADAVVTAYATPRRLAVHVGEVASRAADKAQQTRLMPVAVAFDAAGQPTAALLKKLAASGMSAADVPRLARIAEGKAVAVYADSVVRGAALAEGLQQSLADAVAKLPVPKLMQYQLADGWTSVHFARPAHGLVALHGDAVVPVSVLGLQAGRTTQGHRFEAAQPLITLRSADSYVQQLRDEGAVIAGFADRRAEMLCQIEAAALAEGLRAIDDDALLDEVTGLVERPNVLRCRFDEEFLAVPAECLVLTMKANQKYFPLLDASGGLSNRFLVVSNIRPPDPGRVVEGNERVVRPRLADARFFYEQDRKRTLESRVPLLAKIVYHGRLGSQGERVERVRAIARWVAPRIGADVALADRAALLAKADLTTDMVGEFPELQGVMGGYYARHDGEHPDVAAAIAAQYVVHRGDRREADNLVGEALLIADRVETIVGIWAVGARPTGDKDPYAIRRHALGLIRSIELCAATSARKRRPFALDLRELLDFAAGTFAPGLVSAAALDEVESFVYERCAHQQALVYTAKEVDAVVALRPPLHQVPLRLAAVRDFLALPEASALAAANKRVGNILRKSAAAAPAALDAAQLVDGAERALHAALADAAPRADAAFGAGDYAASLQALAALKAPVDAFFDGVMVNVDDPALRANRLALLARLHAAMNRVADLARLAA